MKLKFLILIAALLQMTATYAQTRQQTDNLWTFARLYGYVRYFHPSDAVVVADWDKLAIYGAQQVEKAKDQKELQQVLEQLFKQIAPTLRIYPSGTHPAYDLQQLTPADTTGMKVVAWQYDGYGEGSNNQTYKSIRTNSYIKNPSPKQSTSSSTIANMIDAKPYQGRIIRYSAAIKVEDLTEGTGHLWLRVDRNDKKPGFFDNMANRPVTGSRTDWRRETITGKVDDNAEQISFGCLILNSGEMLLDDVKLEILTDNGWETIKALNGDFENDTTGLKPANWQTNSHDPAFTVKVTSQAATSGKQALYLQRKTALNLKATTILFASAMKAGTLITKDLGSGLSMTMPVALYGNGNQTYPLTDTAAIFRQNRIIADQLPAAFTGDDLYIRLADVIITWNVFQHFHPYYKEWITDWNKDLKEALTACYQNKTAADFILTLKTLTAKMRDGHTSVSSKSRPEGTGGACLPAKWEWIEDQLVVTRIVSPSSPLQKGDIIRSINGIPAKEYLANAAKLISAGSANALMEAAVNSTYYATEGSSLKLSVTKNGQPVNITYNVSFKDFYKQDESKEAWKQIDPDIVYVNMSLMPWTDMKAKLPELSKAPNVIFDLRGYPKDGNAFSILAHLLKQPENAKWMQKQQLSLPDHEKTGWDSLGWSVQPAGPHIAGNVFFLTNGSAISYAESVMGYIKGQKLATIIGETTAGANGDYNSFALPGDYTVSFTGLKVTTHQGAQHFMKGIAPDVTVHKTIRGIMEDQDEILNKAIELSKKAAATAGR